MRRFFGGQTVCRRSEGTVARGAVGERVRYGDACGLVLQTFDLEKEKKMRFLKR